MALQEVSESFSEIIADPEQRAVLRDYMVGEDAAQDLGPHEAEDVPLTAIAASLLYAPVADAELDTGSGGPTALLSGRKPRGDHLT